jgi:hypothetical protein
MKRHIGLKTTDRVHLSRFASISGIYILSANNWAFFTYSCIHSDVFHGAKGNPLSTRASEIDVLSQSSPMPRTRSELRTANNLVGQTHAHKYPVRIFPLDPPCHHYRSALAIVYSCQREIASKCRTLCRYCPMNSGTCV